MKPSGKSPSVRLSIGSKILSATAGIDTTLITARLTAFATVHQSYGVAQQKVEAGEVKVRNEQARLTQLDVEQDAAVEELATLLPVDGQPRSAPFAAFGADAPSVVKQLPCGEEAKVVRKLVAAVCLDTGVGRATLAAARRAENAASAIEATLLALDTHLATVRDARAARDAIVPAWEAALASLKRGARAATDDGAPGLYTALFGRPTRARKAKSAAAAEAAPSTTAAAA